MADVTCRVVMLGLKRVDGAVGHDTLTNHGVAVVVVVSVVGIVGTRGLELHC